MVLPQSNKLVTHEMRVKPSLSNFIDEERMLVESSWLVQLEHLEHRDPYHLPPLQNNSLKVECAENSPKNSFYMHCY